MLFILLFTSYHHITLFTLYHMSRHRVAQSLCLVMIPQDNSIYSYSLYCLKACLLNAGTNTLYI